MPAKDWMGASIVAHPLHTHDHGMSTANNPGVTLEFEAGADPIRGSIKHPDGSRKPFWGWLELMDELRRAAAEKPESVVKTSESGAGPPPEPDAASQPRATTTQSRT
jgi:hypothetical protein